MTHTVVTLPGDGIGRLVLPEAIRILDAVGFDADYIHADVGLDCWATAGEPLPAHTLKLLRQYGLGLFGAITSLPKGKLQAALKPELRDRNLVYTSPILALRRELNLETSIRPCRSIPGNPLNYVRRTRGGTVEEPVIDVVIVSQNTEGLYGGIEWTDPPQAVCAEIANHPRMANRSLPSHSLAVSCRVLTASACTRIANAAFAYAARHSYRSVTLCDKWGVMQETASLFGAAAQEVATAYPELTFATTNIDAQLMWLGRRPEAFDVFLCSSFMGDLLSDAYAGLVGGLGFVASANIGDGCAVFEPVHGSAPAHAQRMPAVVNPIAAIEAGAMLLDHVGETEKARRIRDGVQTVVANDVVRTCDLAQWRVRGWGDARPTTEMTNAIIAAVAAQ